MCSSESSFKSNTCVSDCNCLFFFQAEDGIRYLVRSRGLGDVYKRQIVDDGKLAPRPISEIFGMELDRSGLPSFGRDIAQLSLIHI